MLSATFNFPNQLRALLIAALVSGSAYAQQAELVWSEFNGERHAIKLAAYDDGQWSAPSAPLYVSDNAITAAKLGTDAQGRKILIWTEQIIDKTVLNYLQTDQTSKWSKPKLLYAAGSDNFAGAIVFDSNNVGWFFWSTVDSELADIVYLQFVDGKPGPVQRLHEINDVPDIHATARLDEQGNVVVEWSTFNLEKRRYERVTKLLPVSTTPAASFDEAKELLPDAIPQPQFLPKNSSALVHIPANKMIQSAPMTR